jgi:hypothetical protein
MAPAAAGDAGVLAGLGGGGLYGWLAHHRSLLLILFRTL